MQIAGLFRGAPNNPTTAIVIQFIPIWKLKLAPTRLIMYKRIIPNIEFINSFATILIGKMNNLPNISKIHTHAKYAIIDSILI